MASPGPSGVGSPTDNAHNPDSSRSTVPNVNVQVLGIRVALPRGVYRNPLVKLVLDGQTIVKRDFDKNATELDWMLDVPYIFRDGPSLTIQMCEGRIIGKSKVMAQLPIPFRDACNATDTAPGERIELKLKEDPKVILILASSPKESYAEVLKMGAEIVGQRKNVLDHLGRSKQSFETLLSLGIAISELHPIAKAVLASVNVVYSILKEQERCNDLVLELADDMARTLEYVQDVEQFARVRQLVETLKELDLLLADTQNFIIKYSSQSATANVVSSATSSGGRQIDDLRSRFDRFKHQFDRGLAVQTAINLESLLASAKDDKILEDLKPRGLGGETLPPECMDGTRQDILNEIDEWIADLDAPNILWIKGHPGVGKSAIASSVVHRLRRAKRLGSRFFFERAKAETLTPFALWRMVAFDLSRSYPDIRRHLVAKLDTDRDLPTTGNVDDLFLQLIEEPLMSGDGIPTGRLPVIVIDALDECGGLDGQLEQRKRVLRTLSKWPSIPRKFKIVVTSRAEIGRVLQDISRVIEITAGSGVSRQSSTDIGLFLEMRFHEIVQEYPKLDGWPGMEEIQRLVKQAGGLFIWARVVADFIQHGDPSEQLSRIQRGEAIAGDMVTLYSHILQISFPTPTQTVMINFHSILGVTILARRPLPTQSLGDLLEIGENSMRYICNRLSSVLEFKSVVRITHQSFTDFLIDQTCPCLFRINTKVEEHKLALVCLRTMKSGLRFNICKLESSYRLNSEVVDMESLIDHHIPSHLQYACWYWADHLAASDYENEILELLENFMKVQFLFWLEVLSLTNRMNMASYMMSSLIGYLKKYQKNDTMAVDMQKFITTFNSVMSQSAPHIYISALPFAPQSSAISKQYMPQYTGSLKVEKGGLHGWPGIQNVFHGHKDRVTSVIFSLDGRLIASGSDDNTIRIWDAETGEAVAGPFEGHTEPMAFSPDGRRVVSRSVDGTIKIRDTETGKAVAGLFEDYIGPAKFSPDGRRFASRSDNNMIRIWDVETGEAVSGPVEGYTGPMAFSPDGERVASGDGNKIWIWNAKTGEVVAGPFMGHTSLVYSVAFSPDGRRVASGSLDKTIRIWDAEIGRVVTGPFEGHTGQVGSLIFSPDGGRIASRSYYNTIKIWDVETGEAFSGPVEGYTGPMAFSPDGERVASGDGKAVWIWDAKSGKVVAGPFEGHTEWVNSVAFSPDGKRIASGSVDKTIRIWDAEMGEAVAGPPEGHTDPVIFSPDNGSVASGSWDKPIKIWDAETGRVVAGSSEGHAGTVNSVAFSPNSRHIASGSDDKTIRIWDAETGEAVAGPFEGHTDHVSSVAFSSDGRRVASGSADKTIRIWDAETGEAVSTPFEGHIHSVRSVAFSPDGRSVASGSADTMIKIWDAEISEAVARSSMGHGASVHCVAFSSDGRRVVSGSVDQTIRIWDAETGVVVAGPFEGHTSWVHSVAFSPDGSRVASGSGDGMIGIWDAETGKAVVGPFEGHTDGVKSVAFSPDGRYIASGSDDKMIRIWDAETGEAIAGPFEGHTDYVNSVAFSSDGRRVASGSSDNTLRVWDLKHDQNRTPSLIDTSRMKEGWILDSHNNHLFWAPPALRVGLTRSNNPVIIGNLLVTKLNFNTFEHGNTWSKCQTSASTSS